MSTVDDKIHQNINFSRRLGWAPTDFGALTFDPLLITMITAQQELLGMDVVDGLAGPKTYAALLRAKQAHTIAHASADRLADCGLIALYEAKLAWLSDVVDLPHPASPTFEHSRSIIDALIRTPIGIDWYWEDPYQANGDYEWCGTVAAKGWGRAGLKLAMRRNFFSSNYRLDRWAKYKPHEQHTNPKPPTGPYRKILELDELSRPADAMFGPDDPPREGDILTVGGKNTGPGKHITMVESFDTRTGIFTTIEGNGTGLGPDGMRRHGIVRASRPTGLKAGSPPTIYHARRLIRPALSDCVV